MVTRYKRRLVLLPTKRGAVAVLAGMATAIALVVGGSAAPGSGRPYVVKKAVHRVEPPHEVVYWYAVPAAKAADRFEITYLDAFGRQRKLTQPGYPPAWVELVRTPQGAARLELTVRSSATSSAPMIYCRIQVDGRLLQSSDGNPCRVKQIFPHQETNHRR